MKIHTLLEKDDEQRLSQSVQQYLIELVEVIKRAQPFFQQAGQASNPFYRGAGSKSPDYQIEILRPRLDRKPRDSIQIIHDALDDAMSRDFGYRYRSGAVFVSSDFGVVHEYGSPYIALPLGEFDYCWSIESDDSINWFSPRQYFMYALKYGSDDIKERFSFINNPKSPLFGAELDNRMMDAVNTIPEAKQLFQQWFNSRYDDATYTLRDLPVALENGHEVMIKCAEYAMITPETIGPDEARFLAEYISKPEIEKELFDFTPVSKAIYIIAKHVFGG